LHYQKANVNTEPNPKKEKIMKQENPQIYTIDLAKIEGKGDFSCPNCGVTISPDDQTEDVYEIVETKVHGASLEELTIQCKCGSKIRLTGFIPQN
jgi:DNA-directed RNA polymerase subunit RPC12/RpoP